MDNRILDVLRDQAWQRAKGELQSMLGTIYDNKEYFETLNDLVEKFVENIEDNM